MTLPQSFLRDALIALALLGSIIATHDTCAADPIPPNTSGIALSGRTADEKPLYSWHVFDAIGKKEVAAVDRKWGFTPLPPGEYRVKVRQDNSTVDWVNVTVKPNAAIELKLDSGIELSGRTADEKPVYSWHVFDAAGNKEIAAVSERWGFTPLPPGEYRVKVRQYNSTVDWAKFTVKPGEVVNLKIDSGVELSGRTADEKPVYSWHVFDAAGKKEIAMISERWGFTPLPPGEYRVKVRQYNSTVDWAKFTVKPGEVVNLKIESGVELSGRTADEKPVYSWHVFDAAGKKEIAVVSERWGFTPLPLGEYRVKVRQYNSTVDWANVTIKPGEVVRLKINAGVELTGRTADEKPLYSWHVFDAAGKKEVADVNGMWGFTPLPPGEYRVKVRQDNSTVDWAAISVKSGETTSVRIDSGLDFSGRSPDEKPEYDFSVSDESGKREQARMSARWGFMPLPPGKYRVVVRPPGSSEISLGEATVAPGKVTPLAINSGIELAPRAADEKAPDQWSVLDAKTREVVTKVSGRWGFVPLVPGDYLLAKLPARWGPLRVEAGSAIKTSEPSLEARLALVTGAGRQTEKLRDPVAYKKLEEEVERAIRRAATWLKQQSPLHESSLDLRSSYNPTPGIFALVHAGELERDPELARRLIDYLLRRGLNTSNGTYANALTAMALRDIDPYRYHARVYEAAQWLVENQGSGDAHKAWGYGAKVSGLGEAKEVESQPRRRQAKRQSTAPAKAPASEVVRKGLVAEPNGSWDNSNAQFAVLGLHSAVFAGIGIPRDSWSRIDGHFRETSNEDGGWGYNKGGSYGSMTCAGLASLVIARHHLGEKKPTLDAAAVGGLEWLAWHFSLEENPVSPTLNHYYYLYGLERVGMLAGVDFIGDHEWYPEGARYLLENQNSDGSWASKKGPPHGSPADYLDTCYAILFLRRATLPLEPPKPAFVGVRYEKGALPAALMPAVELILDSSNSMAELMESRPKIQVAKEVAKTVLKGLPEDIQVGLRLYGHWGVWLPRKQNPQAGPLATSDPRLRTDSELVVPIAPLSGAQRDKVLKWIDWTQPRGMTPLVYSLLQAKGDFAAGQRAPKTVVLVSDGEETCGGKLEDVATAYRAAGIEIVIHVVGFDVQGTAAQNQLEQIARLGQGKYYGARNAEELTEALESAIEATGYLVHDEGGAKEAGQGLINGDPVPLKPGKYRVSVLGTRIEPLAVELAAGQELELQIDDEGKLSATK